MQYNLSDLKALVKSPVRFEEYRKGNLWYKSVGFPDFIFPVPIEDIGDGIFKREDSGMFLCAIYVNTLKILNLRQKLN